MDAEGNNVRRLTDDPARDLFPAWSPNGRMIAWGTGRGRPGLGWEIWLMDADGGNPTSLVAGADWDAYPAWSLDGREIALTTRDHKIAVVDVNTRAVRRLTVGPQKDAYAHWGRAGWLAVSPGGKHGALWGHIKAAGR
jgi:TolB protein